MKRVLQVIGGLDRGGAETLMMEIYRHIDREQVQFDFLVYGDQIGDYEEEAKDLGAKVIHIPLLIRNVVMFGKCQESW